MLRMKIYLILLTIIILSIPSFAQYKGKAITQDNVIDGILNKNKGGILGIFDPHKFRMDHIYNLSFSTYGDYGRAVGSYTNRIFYRFSDKFNIQLWTSLVTTPYSTSSNSNDKLNGIYIDKAALNINPSKNFFIELQFSNNPYRFYNAYYNYNRFGGSNYGYHFNPFIY